MGQAAHERKRGMVALTVPREPVYHPPAIRVRLQGHPSVIGQVALLLKESRSWQGTSASMR
jgi:hypothetical protein